LGKLSSDHHDKKKFQLLCYYIFRKRGKSYLNDLGIAVNCDGPGHTPVFSVLPRSESSCAEPNNYDMRPAKSVRFLRI
jgi:hypothetical protein